MLYLCPEGGSGGRGWAVGLVGVVHARDRGHPVLGSLGPETELPDVGPEGEERDWSFL